MNVALNVASGSLRITLVTIASCSLMIPGSGLAAEGNSPTPPPMRTVHPQISRLSLSRKYESMPVSSATKVEEEIRQALNKPMQCEFQETELRDVVSQVRDTLQIPVAIDVKAFEHAGIDVEAPVTFSAENVSARSALRRLLDRYDLTWIVRDECLLITTKDMAAENLVHRIYPVPCGFASDGNVYSLVDLVQKLIEPTTWSTVGLYGTIQVPNDGRLLMISQTEKVHEDIEALLRSLHARGLAELGVVEGNAAPGSPVTRVHPVADGRAREDLAQKLAALCNASLAGGDPQAKVTPVGGCLVVQSVSPEFHILAEQLIRGVAGVAVPDSPPPVGGGMGGGITASGAF